MGIVRRLFCGLLFVLLPTGALGAQYEISKITHNVYAALALPEGKTVSNAFFVITEYEVILVGAHFLPEGVKELVAEVAKITPLPITQIVLTHHHKGFNYVDFDLPEKAEIVVSATIWQTLKSELREFNNPTLVFDSAVTLNRKQVSIVIMNTGAGHSSGDVIVYLPNEGVLFASDLLFNDVVGYMGDASIQEWGESLDLLERLMPRKVIPGVGRVSDGSAIVRFKKFYRAFMTEVIRNVEKGNTLAQTKKEFSLEQYKGLPGYDAFLEINIERAYKQLKSKR
jgi:glyoxylase-like metal-dependent hydrolase (beta-lactamase superfamily II)